MIPTFNHEVEIFFLRAKRRGCKRRLAAPRQCGSQINLFGKSSARAHSQRSMEFPARQSNHTGVLIK